tara:strand:- start:1594 stop:2526 length:933 start_codon:yes stop_codon:yes gene_type:complete
MMIQKKIIFIIFFIFVNFKSFSSENIFIIYNIDNEIITNVDVKKESRYLIMLNQQLKELDKTKIFEVAKKSALREALKNKELSKFFNLNEVDVQTEKYLKTIYLRLKLNNKNELLNYLKINNLTIEYVEKKVQIELAWNQLIYDKYKNRVSVDSKKLLREIKANKSLKDERVYLLSEIVFEKDDQDNLNEKISNINQSINEIGFKNTANIYSIADSSKFGGNIGWVEEKKLNIKILKELVKSDTDKITKPIQFGNSFIILKIEGIKYQKRTTDESLELKRKVQFETNRQLAQFSKTYYNKIKINAIIDEL